MKNKWIKEMSWLGDDYLKGKVRGVVLSFHGLNGGIRNEFASAPELEIAANGGLVLHPYYGPWSWMNRQARDLVDHLVEAVFEEFELGDDIPVISTGGSMGGLSCLLYCRYGRHRPVACQPLYPVCDLEYHYRERSDLPTSIQNAFLGYPEPLAELLAEHSPLHQAEKMPRIPYYFIHGDRDKSVNKELHSDKMVARLKELNHDVEYLEIPGMGHGTNMPFEATFAGTEFVLKHLK